MAENFYDPHQKAIARHRRAPLPVGTRGRRRVLPPRVIVVVRILVVKEGVMPMGMTSSSFSVLPQRYRPFLPPVRLGVPPRLLRLLFLRGCQGKIRPPEAQGLPHARIADYSAASTTLGTTMHFISPTITVIHLIPLPLVCIRRLLYRMDIPGRRRGKGGPLTTDVKVEAGAFYTDVPFL